MVFGYGKMKYNKAIANITILDLIAALILAAMFTVSPQYINTGSFVFNGASLLQGGLYYFGIIAAAMLLRRLLKLPKSAASHFNWFERLLNHRFATLLLALLVLVMWLPSLITLYPGTVINDTWGQLSQYVYTFYLDGEVHIECLGDHHPVVSTLIMGAFIIPLASKVGNLQISLFIFVLLQAFFTCLAFAYSLVYMWRTLRVGNVFTFICFAVYCLLPLYPASVQVISKDAMSAWIFVFFTVFFIELIRTKGKSLDIEINRYMLVLCCWAYCATKKVGIYVVVISLIAAGITIAKHKKRVLLYAGALIMLFNIIWPMVMGHFGIIGGGKTEMLSLPFQMTARCVKEYPDDITPEEYASIDRILYIRDLPIRYDPTSADPVKGFAFYERFTNEEYAAYIKTWVKQGLRHPDSYVNAVLAMESGWFSWTEYVPLLNMDWHGQLNTQIFSEESTVRPEGIRQAADLYQKLLDRLYKIPILGLLFTYGLYAALLPAFIICTLLIGCGKNLRKRKGIHAWVAAMPMFFSIALGCWLAPVSIHFEGRRYLFPVTYTIIVLLAFCRWWVMDSCDEEA